MSEKIKAISLFSSAGIGELLLQKEKINVTIENIDGTFIKVTDVDTGYSINYWGVWSNRYEFLDDFLKRRKENEKRNEIN